MTWMQPFVEVIMLLVFIAVAVKVRRLLSGFGAQLQALEGKIRDLDQRISDTSLEMQNAVSVSQLGFRFPVFLRESSIDSFHARHLIQQIVEIQPETVLELGSGSSTVLIARALELLGLSDPRHICVDHDPFFLELSKRYAALNHVADRVEFRVCPLGKVAGEEWYTGVPDTVGDRKIDLLIVDGPPAYLPEAYQARYQALPQLHEHLSPSCAIMLDDANRPGEISVVERWMQEYPEFTLTRVAEGKGAAILTRRARRE